MSAEEWQIIRFTLATSLGSVLLIAGPGVLLAYLLARREWVGKSVVEALVTLPLVMPPVATGLLLLELLGRRHGVGKIFHQMLGWDFIFDWKGVVLAQAIMSFPLLVRTARVAIEQVNPRLEQVARTLGAGRWGTFFRVTAPLASRGLWAGAILAFARALGEFGATIVVAGAIPGKTMTLSVSIYQSFQLGNDSAALRLILVSFAVSFGAVLAGEWFLRHAKARV